MNDSLNHKIFTETDCLSEQTLFDYIDKKLSAKENHVVEKHMLHCDLCSDALEGLEMVKDRNRIATINQKVLEAISPPLKETKVIQFNYKVILSIAATLLLLIGGTFLFNMLNHKNEVAEFKAEETTSQEPPPPSGAAQNKTLEEEPLGNASPMVSEATPTTTTKNSQENDGKQDRSRLQESKEAQKEQAEPEDADGGATDGNEMLTRISTTSTNVSPTKEKNMEFRSERADTDKESPKLAKDLYVADTKKPEAAGAGASEQNKAGAVYSLSQTAPQPSELKPVTDDIVLTDKASDNVTKASLKNNANNKKSSEDKAKRKEETEQINTIAYAPQSATQSMDEVSAAESAIEINEKNPQYPGGQDSLISFIRKKFSTSLLAKYSQLAKQTAEVKFTVDKKGALKNPSIVKGLNPEMDAELMRVLKLSSKWVPASVNGEAVAKEMNLPVKLSKE